MNPDLTIGTQHLIFFDSAKVGFNFEIPNFFVSLFCRHLDQGTKCVSQPSANLSKRRGKWQVY